MGLDLYHLKPCATPVDPTLFFSMEELADAPAAFIEKHRHLMVQVAVPPDILSDFIFAGEQQAHVFEKQSGKQDDCRLLTGLYFRECGYQRKQMNFRFYDDFTNNKLYFSIDDVLCAYQYIEPWKGAKEETFRNFRENFIDNFEGGISAFFPGW